MSTTHSKDFVARALTDDGAFRVVAARTTDLVQGVFDAQAAEGETARHFGDLLTASVLIRETMAPTQRLQAIITDAERNARLVADSHPGGGTRGLLTLLDGTDHLDLRGGRLEVMRTMFSGGPHRGLVEVPDGGGISETIMGYMASSEQVASMLALSTVIRNGRVVMAGGYIVQLLPEVGRGPLAIMAERLRDFENIDELMLKIGGDPVTLIGELLYGMPFTMVEERSRVAFECICSTVRVLSSLATIGRDEISSMVAEAQAIDVTCDYCGKVYTVSPMQLSGLLDES